MSYLLPQNAGSVQTTGTFTPALTPTTSGSITLGDDTLSYIKTGLHVHIEGFIDVGSTSSPVGNLTLTGLPFTSEASAVSSEHLNGFPIVSEQWSSAPANLLIGRIGGGSTTIIFLDGANGTGGTSAVSAGDVQSSTGFYFNFSYTANA